MTWIFGFTAGRSNFAHFGANARQAKSAGTIEATMKKPKPEIRPVVIRYYGSGSHAHGKFKGKGE